MNQLTLLHEKQESFEQQAHFNQQEPTELSAYTSAINVTKGREKEREKVGNVTEIILPPAMADNIQILLPMLTLLNQDKRWLAWIDPPTDLLSRWRHQSQIVNTEIMILRSNQKNSAFDLARQALNAGTCHAVITWTKGLSNGEMCQLEIASCNGNSHGVILRLR